MTEITDEYMGFMMSNAKNYSIVILKKTDKINEPGT